MKKIGYLLGILFISQGISMSAHAATVDIVPEEKGEFGVYIILGQGEQINAIEGTLIVNAKATVSPVAHLTNSMITLWTVPPVFSDNTVSFSGLIPGGFGGVYDQFTGALVPRGKLFSFTLGTLAKGEKYTFLMDSMVAYAHDGRATPIVVPIHCFSFTVRGNTVESTALADATPPVFTVARIEKSPALFDGNSFVVFQATDDTGIASYWIQEGDSGWVRGTSPYELVHQKNIPKISIKAVDFAGNENITFIKKKLPLADSSLVIVYGLVLCALLYGIFHIQKKRKKSHR